MKVVFGLFVLVGLGIFLAFQFGGVASLDPAEQGKKLQTTVTSGMPWQQVADQFPPKRYSVVFMGDQGFPQGGPEVKFDRAAFEKDFTAGNLKLGFSFVYIYGAESQFAVSFDADGKVGSVDKLATMGDLLSPR